MNHKPLITKINQLASISLGRIFTTKDDAELNEIIEAYVADKTARLQAEHDKWKAIVDTHNLCHDLHGKVGAREFADGCAAEQRKLFGCAPDADEVTRLKTKWIDS